MNILKQFWSQFIASISNLTFYQQRIKQPLRYVLGYFYGATILFGVGSALWFQFYFLPRTSLHASAVRTEIINSIPDTYGIQVNTQRLQLVTYDATGTAVLAKQELRIPSPPSLPKLISIPESQINAWNKEWPSNLLIISPNTISNPDDYLLSLNTQTLFLIEPSGIYVFDGTSWEHTQFEQLNQTELTAVELKQTLNEWFDRAGSFINKYAHLAWPIICVGTLLANTLTLGWYSLLTFLVSKAFNHHLSYRQCLKITAYIAVVAQLISFITQVVYPWFGIDMFGVSFWAICLYVLYVLKTAQIKPQLDQEKT